MSSLQRHLYRCVLTIISTYISKEWISTIFSTYISKGEILQSSLLASLQSKFLQSSLLTSLRNIFLQCLYKDIPIVTYIPSKPKIFLQDIHSKPEILLQSIWEFMILSKQVKPEVYKIMVTIIFITIIICIVLLQVHLILCDWSKY